MTTSGWPTGTGSAGAVDEDVLSLDIGTGPDGAVTVSAAGEVDTFTAPLLQAALEIQLQRQPQELVLDLRGVQFLGSAGLALLVETQKAADTRGIRLLLIATTRPVTRPLQVTGLLDIFTVVSA